MFPLNNDSNFKKFITSMLWGITFCLFGYIFSIFEIFLPQGPLETVSDHPFNLDRSISIILLAPKTYSFQNVQIINILPFLILKLIFHYNSHMNDQHHLVIHTQAWKLLFTLLTSYLHTKTFIHSDQFCVPDFLKYIYFCHFHCYFIVTTALEMCLYLQCCLF